MFEAKFQVKTLNPNGKKFAKVNRILCQSKDYELWLDHNCEKLKLKVGDQIRIRLTTVLDCDPGSGNPSDVAWDHIMHGKVFRTKKSSICVSFGGLLMKLAGPKLSDLPSLERDRNIFLCLQFIE